MLLILFVYTYLGIMIDTLVTSKTRVKLLLKFFLNRSTTSWLRDLENEFGESTNSIRLELNRFEKAGMLESFTRGNKKIYRANSGHPLFDDVHNIIMKYVGIDRVVDKVISKIGELHSAYLTGDFAKGKDSRMIDLLLVGENIDRLYLLNLVEKGEKLVKRKIRYIIINPGEIDEYLGNVNNAVLLWHEKNKVNS